MTTTTESGARQWRHDVRTPLNHVLGYGELVRDSLAGDAAAAAPLRALLGEAQALLRTLDSGDARPAAGPSAAGTARADDDACAARLKAMQRHTLEVRSILARHGQAELVRDMDKVLSGLQALDQALGQVLARPLPAGSRAAGEEPVATAARPRPAAAPAAHPAGAGTVLVVDDDAANRELLTRAVVALGHAVLQAADGAAGLQVLRRQAVDVVLLDLRMPGMGGLAVLHAIQDDETLRRVPVLIVSADADRDTAVRCIEEGAVDYLPKPAEPAILRARIAACLAAKRVHDHEAQLHEQRTAMLAGISHDLRQPLQAVRMFGDAMRRHVRDEGLELLARQNRAADAAVEMLDRFADFSALAQGAIVPSPMPLDLLRLACEVRDHVVTGTAPGAVSVRVHGRPCWVRTDHSLMSRILQNLLGNAVRCTTAAGRARPRVVLAIRRQANSVVVDVIDNGPGMPTSVTQRLFEPYLRSTHGGGRGLGLAIVAGLCRQLGLEPPALRTMEGKGTRFRVRLPAEALAAPVTPVADPGPVAIGPANGLPLEGWLLGLLDDESEALDATASALRCLGARCVAANDSAMLESMLEHEIRFPDVLVVDLDLGVEDSGLDVIDRLRRTWESCVPALVMTGGTSVIGNLPARCALLRKPMRLEDLVAALRGLLRP